MKVLLINKYLYKKGGTETYTFGIKEMLEKNGHKVMLFSMKDPKNFSTKYEKYFVENIDFNKNKLKGAFKLIYSREAERKLENLILAERPDVCHVNLIYHHLTPSIFHVLKKYNIPIVFTAHDYKIICPNYKLWNKGKMCKKCKGGKYYNCIKNKCHKNSYIFSSLLTIEAYLHKIINSYDNIDFIISPSGFMRDCLVEFGIKREKIKLIPNFIDTNNKEIDNIIGDYILYFGRLSEEKGIETFIKSKQYVNSKLNYKIVGVGPIEEHLKEVIRQNGIENIELCGFLQGEELKNMIKNSRLVVVPSEWNEVFGLTAIEAFLNKKIVIASKEGGLKELIENEKNGYLFNTGDCRDLAEKIDRAVLNSEGKLKQMQEYASENAIFKYNDRDYYNKLIEIYNLAISNH